MRLEYSAERALFLLLTLLGITVDSLLTVHGQQDTLVFEHLSLQVTKGRLMVLIVSRDVVLVQESLTHVKRMRCQIFLMSLTSVLRAGPRSLGLPLFR